MKQVFVSLIIVAQNTAKTLEANLKGIEKTLQDLVSDYEIIIIDNASTDASDQVYSTITAEGGLVNIQIHRLASKVKPEVALWFGFENAIGDYIFVVDPEIDDPSAFGEMLAAASAGNEIVFAVNKKQKNETIAYRLGRKVFSLVFQFFTRAKIDINRSEFRILSRNVINFILKYPQPAASFRNINAIQGFKRATVFYSSEKQNFRPRMFSKSFVNGIRLLISTSHFPLRLATSISGIGAIANLVYSIYVLTISQQSKSLAKGWASTSLQLSGMFFLISLVLMILAEYILHLVTLNSGDPKFYVSSETKSKAILHKQKLNVETPNIY